MRLLEFARKRGLMILVLAMLVPAAASAQDVPTQIILGGQVKAPKTYDRAALAAMPQASLKVGDATYTGVLLWSLLQDAGLVLDPSIKADVLRKAVVATANDGYKVAISIGEIHPTFGNQPCLIALQQDGADFSSGGFARLIFPSDVKRGRWVRDLTELRVSEVP
jgi:hypothetical protein